MTGGKLWAELDEKGGADPHLLAADQNLNMWRENSNQQVQYYCIKNSNTIYLFYDIFLVLDTP